MQQLDLLTIHKQPAPRKPEIPSRVIKAYVKQNLRNFSRRQAERERLRAEARKREKPRSKRPNPKQGNFPNMRTIKVTYRAIFAQPIKLLNPFESKIGGQFPVEVFHHGGKWQARTLTTPPIVYKKLGKCESADAARIAVEDNFQERLEPWQVWGKPPNEFIERMLLPSEIADLGNGKTGWKQAEDYTHIIHAPSIPPGAHVPPAACGATVKAECFISTKAYIEPTCKGCAEVWRREYQGK